MTEALARNDKNKTTDFFIYINNLLRQTNYTGPPEIRRDASSYCTFCIRPRSAIFSRAKTSYYFRNPLG